MSRYIDAEKLEQRLRDFSDWCRDDRKDGVDFVLNGVLADTPTADVQEVRNGEWDEIRDAYGHLEGWIHRDCGRMSMAKENYCPNCGTKMGGDGK